MHEVPGGEEQDEDDLTILDQQKRWAGTRRLLWYGGLLGIFNFLGSSLQQQGIEFLTSAESSFFSGLYVLFTPVVQTAVPWLVTFFFSSFFVSNFETLLIFLRQDPAQLDFFHFAKQTIRVSLSVIVGMTFAQPWMSRFKGASQSS
jgi:hypothetical protein